jgi:hypothetical protein
MSTRPPSLLPTVGHCATHIQLGMIIIDPQWNPRVLGHCKLAISVRTQVLPESFLRVDVDWVPLEGIGSDQRHATGSMS